MTISVSLISCPPKPESYSMAPDSSAKSSHEPEKLFFSLYPTVQSTRTTWIGSLPFLVMASIVSSSRFVLARIVDLDALQRPAPRAKLRSLASALAPLEDRHVVLAGDALRTFFLRSL